MIIDLDAKGAAEYLPRIPGEDPREAMRRIRKERKAGILPPIPKGSRQLSSGGANYYVIPGEYPALDRMYELETEFRGDVPEGEIPFELINELAQLALSYDTSR